MTDQAKSSRIFQRLREIERRERALSDERTDLYGELENDAGEPPVEPDPAPEPSRGKISLYLDKGTRALTVTLPDADRASLPPMRSEERAPAWGAFDFGNPFIEHFRTEAGGVVETICVLHNGNPQGRGAIRIPRLEVQTHNGRVVCSRRNVEIDPGQPCVVVDYANMDGQVRPTMQRMLDFSAGLAVNGPSAGEAFDKKLVDELASQLSRAPDVGHYIMGWPADKSGASQGGDGIEPYWHLWRNWAAGRALALLEVQRTAQREFRVMTDESGAFTWDPEIAYNADGDNMPPDFERDRSTELGTWYSHDAQHLHRAYRAAMWIDSLTKGRHAFSRWYLEMMANFQAACCLSTAADDKGVDDSNWWSLERTVEWARKQGPNPKMGRGMVHRSRLIFYCADNGIGGVEMQRAAELVEELWAVSANSFGRSFEMEARKIPAVKREMEKPGGGRAAGWQDDDECAQSRELQLAVAMLRDSGRERLVSMAGNLARNIGPFPSTQLNYTRGKAFGGTNYGYELMTHGVTTSEEFGGPDAPAEERRKNLLRVAESRSVEAGGVQPLNSCNDPSIWLPPRQRP